MVSDADLIAAGAKRVERIGDAVLVLGDCREIAPKLPRPDAIVSDPPYGMKWDGEITGGRGGNSPGSRSKHYGERIVGDEEDFDPYPWTVLGVPTVLWGANHYANRLPLGTTLIWIKRLDGGFGSFLSDAEVAWMRGGCGVYCQRDTSLMGETLARAHPTQKPVGIMEWCLERAKVDRGAVVLDPYMGSGTTGVACLRRGVRFVGIEIEPRYFDVACRRVAEAARQPALFHHAPQPRAEQMALSYPTESME